MISFDNLSGNAALRRSLQNALAGRFPQTVLLSGDDTESLSALSVILAAAILCDHKSKATSRPCGTCLSCRKVEKGIHPDILLIDEGENELKVELARRIKAENALIPNDGPRRVTIIRHAQNLNPAAQNALLKELEEPPSFAFFILTAEQPDALLETVRSRCTRFALEPPVQADQDASADEETVTLLTPYLAAVAAGREDQMMKAALAFEKIPRRTMTGLLGVLQAAFRDAVFAAEHLPLPLLQPAMRTETNLLAGRIPVRRLLAAYDFLDTVSRRVSHNAAAAAVTCALTADVFRICFLET